MAYTWEKLPYWQEAVMKFNKDIIGIPEPTSPQLLSRERLAFAKSHLLEEIDEFTKATIEGNIAEAADGLIDLIYIALGRLYEMGTPILPIFENVHQSNMKRVKGRKTRTVENDLDAIKPANWTTPDHSWLEFVSPVIVEACKIRKSKTQDYDGSGIKKADYFPFGIISYAQMIWVKALRIRSLVGINKPNNESLRDSFLDLINYAIYAIEYIDDLKEKER